MDKKKRRIYQQLMWDYNISPEEVDKLVKGETEFAGHYDINNLFQKILESFPWFVVLQIFDIDTIQKLLTDKTINKLRMPDLREKYKYVKNRLQKIILAAK